LGFFLAGLALRWTLTAICLALIALGVARRGNLLRGLSVPLPTRRREGWLLALFVVQLAIVLFLSWRLWLGWDALLIWELRARVASLNGGLIPLDFFTNPTRIWPHTSLSTVATVDRGLVVQLAGPSRPGEGQVTFPVLLSVGSQPTLGRGRARSARAAGKATWSPLLLFFSPLTWIGEGSASSGYADFPLAVCYLAAAVYALEYWQTGAGAALRLVGLLGAALCWVKEEGAILWVCLLVVVSIKVISAARMGADYSCFSVPGLLLLGSWRHLPKFRASASVDGLSAFHSHNALGQLGARADHFIKRFARRLSPGKVERAVGGTCRCGVADSRSLPPVNR
jgi:hypothetical protein